MCGLSARLVRNCSAFSLLVASALLSILWTGELGPMGLLSGVELNPEQSTASVFHGPVQPQPCPNHSMPVCSPCAEKNLSDAVGSEGPAQYRQENNRTVERHGDGPGSNDTEVHSRDWFSEFSDFAFAVITGRQKQQALIPALWATWLPHFQNFVLASDTADPVLRTTRVPRRAFPSGPPQSGGAALAQVRFVDAFMEVCARWPTGMTAYGIVDDDTYIHRPGLRRLLDHIAANASRGNFVAGYTRHLEFEPLGGLIVVSRVAAERLCRDDHYLLRMCLHSLVTSRPYPFRTRHPGAFYNQDHVWGYCVRQNGGENLDVAGIYYEKEWVLPGLSTRSDAEIRAKFSAHKPFVAVHHLQPAEIRRMAAVFDDHVP